MKRLILLCFLLTAFSCSDGVKLKNFDSERWKRDMQGCGQARAELVEDLLNQKNKLLGLDQNELLAILGTPDKHELYRRNQKFFKYYTGPGPGCEQGDVNSPNLSIRFNALGLVSEVVHYN